jgi:hypothetical protein
MLVEKKLVKAGARLEHSPRKFLRRLAQETGVDKFSISSSKFAHQCGLFTKC